MIEFKLPEVAEGVMSADIAEIAVSEGDDVAAGQVVMEVETEKAVVEIECPHAGRIAKIHVSPGDTVDIGAVLLSIEETAPAKSDEAAPKSPEPSAESNPPVPPADSPPQQAEPTAASPVAKSEPVVATEPRPINGRTASEQRGRTSPPPPAAPSTRRLARLLGVDLQDVQGSGPGGRIVVEDVQAHVRAITTRTSAMPATGLTVKPSDVSSAMAAPQLPDFTRFGPITRQPLNKIARSAAANLSYSWQTIPHVTQHDLADITDLEAARKRFLETAGKSGPKVTMTAIIVKAVVAALKANPLFNASLDLGTGDVVLKEYYHIGIAVDTDHGLLVPVIRDADRKSILQIAAELLDMAERARIRKLSLDEMQGATFTITNLGGIGGTAFTPIINFPEVAILGLSRSQKQLELVGGQVSERLKLPLSLSYDHRVINGADAARFIVRLSAVLSDFMRLLVEC